MLFHGQHLYNNDKTQSFRVCAISKCGEYVAIADMEHALKSDNVPKPEVHKISRIPSYLCDSLSTKAIYKLPAQFTFSDATLTKQGYEKWLTKRDKKWAQINQLCTKENMHKYLFGKGLGKEIHAEVMSILTTWNTKGAYFNAINRYLTFGMTPNALLPFRLLNVGNNYKTIDKPIGNVLKRGRGGKANQYSRSKTRGITNQDKINIKRVLKSFSAHSKKFSMTRAFETFQENYETTPILRTVKGTERTIYLPVEIENTISFDQFYYHAKRILTRPELLELEVGKLRFEKDFKDRQGYAHDGLLGATQRYEVDATVLDLYVRYPYDTSGRFSMGRPVLYIVIDVFSTMIVGFYIGFDGPNWGGVSQALVNACLDKVQFAKRYGLIIEHSDWPANHIPKEITIDNGTEYPDGLLESVLQNEIGVEAVNIAAAYRGDAKGTCERTFKTLNDQFIHYSPGSIFKEARGEQHPSNQSLYDYDALVCMMISEVIYHNSTADRLKRFNWQSTVEDIDINPTAIYKHSLRTDMNGGRPTKTKDEAKVRWAFLREESATVRDNAIFFEGLEYYSEYAKKAGWFARARHHGRYTIHVKRVRDWCNTIWHKTENGEYVELQLKNVNNESPWLNSHWEVVMHQLEKNKDKRKANDEKARQQRAVKKTSQSHIITHMQNEIGTHADSTRVSMQPGINDRKVVQKYKNTEKFAQDTRQALSQEKALPSPQTDGFDLDEELYL